MTLREMLELIACDTPTYVSFDDGKDVSSCEADHLLFILNSSCLDMAIERIGCEDNQIKIWTE